MKINFHDLRETYAIWTFIKSEDPGTVSDRLRHSSTLTTPTTMYR